MWLKPGAYSNLSLKVDGTWVTHNCVSLVKYVPGDVLGMKIYDGPSTEQVPASQA